MRPRATPVQAARRDDKVLEYWLAGYGQFQIARALEVEPTSIVDILDRVMPGRPRNVRQRRMDDPKPFDWRAEPEPELGGEVMGTVASFVSSMKGINYRNQFAHAVREATPEWLAGVQRVLDGLAEVSESLELILADPDYREEVATTSAGRDDLPQRLTYEEMVERVIPLVAAQRGMRRRQIAAKLGGVYEHDPKFIQAVSVARERVRKGR